MGVTFDELQAYARPDPKASKNDPQSRELILKPGEAGEIVKLTIDRVGAVSIVAMGVTQHPGSTYEYVADGRSKHLPVPMGTLFNMLWTCRDIGQHIDVYQSFSIRVTNGSPTAKHRYAALVLYKVNRAR